MLYFLRSAKAPPPPLNDVTRQFAYLVNHYDYFRIKNVLQEKARFCKRHNIMLVIVKSESNIRMNRLIIGFHKSVRSGFVTTN